MSNVYKPNRRRGRSHHRRIHQRNSARPSSNKQDQGFTKFRNSPEYNNPNNFNVNEGFNNNFSYNQTFNRDWNEGGRNQLGYNNPFKLGDGQNVCNTNYNPETNTRSQEKTISPPENQIEPSGNLNSDNRNHSRGRKTQPAEKGKPVSESAQSNYSKNEVKKTQSAQHEFKTVNSPLPDNKNSNDENINRLENKSTSKNSIPKDNQLPAKDLAVIKTNIKCENDKSGKEHTNVTKAKDTSSSSDSEDSTVEDLKTAIKTNISTKKIEHFPEKIIKKESVTKSKLSSTSSSSSDSSSSTSSNTHAKSKPTSEEDVICLGKDERIENLIDDDDDDILSISKTTDTSKKCLLCDKLGHSSYQCHMICMNCGVKYHGLRQCSKPANLSIVLQQFMQFCLNQLSKYSPDERFIFDNKGVSSNSQDFANDVNISKEHRRKSYTRSSLTSNRSKCSPVPSTASRMEKRRAKSTDSDSLSDGKSEKRKKLKYANEDDSQKHVMPPFSANMPFTTAPFNPSIPFGFNPMLALGQMMGFNPTLGFIPTKSNP